MRYTSDQFRFYIFLFIQKESKKTKLKKYNFFKLLSKHITKRQKNLRKIIEGEKSYKFTKSLQSKQFHIPVPYTPNIWPVCSSPSRVQTCGAAESNPICTVLYCAVLYCSLLYSKVLYYIILYCTTLYFNTQ